MVGAGEETERGLLTAIKCNTLAHQNSKTCTKMSLLTATLASVSGREAVSREWWLLARSS